MFCLEEELRVGKLRARGMLKWENGGSSRLSVLSAKLWHLLELPRDSRRIRSHNHNRISSFPMAVHVTAMKKQRKGHQTNVLLFRKEGITKGQRQDVDADAGCQIPDPSSQNPDPE